MDHRAPGHGLSAKPRTDYSLGAHANMLRDLLDRLGHDRVTLVGHSPGGGVAVLFAYECRQRVEALMLVARGGLGGEVAGLQWQPAGGCRRRARYRCHVGDGAVGGFPDGLRPPRQGTHPWQRTASAAASSGSGCCRSRCSRCRFSQRWSAPLCSLAGTSGG
jgi:pimeloyl-ACP methyl ester carboxylesterase